MDTRLHTRSVKMMSPIQPSAISNVGEPAPTVAAPENSGDFHSELQQAIADSQNEVEGTHQASASGASAEKSSQPTTHPKPAAKKKETPASDEQQSGSSQVTVPVQPPVLPNLPTPPVIHIEPSNFVEVASASPTGDDNSAATVAIGHSTDNAPVALAADCAPQQPEDARASAAALVQPAPVPHQTAAPKSPDLQPATIQPQAALAQPSPKTTQRIDKSALPSKATEPDLGSPSQCKDAEKSASAPVAEDRDSIPPSDNVQHSSISHSDAAKVPDPAPASSTEQTRTSEDASSELPKPKEPHPSTARVGLHESSRSSDEAPISVLAPAQPAVSAAPEASRASGVNAPELLSRSQSPAAPSTTSHSVPHDLPTSKTIDFAAPIESAELPQIGAAQLIHRGAASELRVGMNTPELGRIEITATAHASGIAATVHVERNELHQALAAELPQMQKAVPDSHIELRPMNEMSFSASTNGQSRQQHESMPQEASTPVLYGDRTARPTFATHIAASRPHALSERALDLLA